MKISKTFLYLILIVLLAFTVRLYSAYHVDIGTDEMIYSVIPLNIISAQRLSTVEQAPLYFYLTDIGYKIMGGMTLVGSRVPSIVFGAVATIIVFLITMEIFSNKKAALWSSFFYALSGYAIRFNQEMDMTAFFFVLLSIYFFIKALKSNRCYLYAATLFLALAVLIKPIVLLFVPAYTIIFLTYGYKYQKGLVYRNEAKIHFNLQWLTTILLCMMMAFMVVSPVLAYNYLLYEEKGMTDYYFSVLAGVGNHEIYQGQEAESWTFARLFTIIKIIFSNIVHYDALVLFLGILGMTWGYKKEKYYSGLLILSTLFLLLYLGGKMSSPTHYVWIPIILSIFAGQAAVQIQEGVQRRFTFKHILIILAIAAFLSTFVVLKNVTPLREQSIAIALNDYAAKNIPDNAIVVIDPRIYRGILAWSFNDRHYLEGTYFPQLLQAREQLPGTAQNLPFYYIECAPGTYCGWKPEDFERIYNFSEQLSTAMKTKTTKVGEINAIDKFIVYQGIFTASPAIYELIDRTHSFWYTPVGWKYTENAIDNYSTDTFLRKALNGFGFFILWIDVAIALLSGALVFYLLWKQSD